MQNLYRFNNQYKWELQIDTNECFSSRGLLQKVCSRAGGPPYKYSSQSAGSNACPKAWRKDGSFTHG
jgi:hypothetical protein